MLNATYTAVTPTVSFSQDWTDISLITANNVWDNVPSIIGFNGSNLTSATGADPQLIVKDTNAAPDSNTVSVNANATSATANAGGVTEFQITNPTIGLVGSGTADAPNLVLHIDANAVPALRVRYTLRDLEGTPDNAVQPIALQYRLGSTGDFINVPAAFIADATTAVAGPDISVDVTIPEAGGSDEVQLRIIGANAVGNDENVGIDNIIVSAGVAAAGPGTLAFNPSATTVTEAAGTINLTVSRTDGSAGAVSATYTLTNGSAVGGSDFTSATGTVSFADGASTATIPVTILEDGIAESTENFTVVLTSPTGGATLGGANTATVTVTDNDVAGFLAFNPATYSVNEGAGTATLTVRRTGGSALGEVSVAYQSFAGTAADGSDFTGVSGTLVFPEGETAALITVPIIENGTIEPIESFTVILSAPAGNALLGTNTTATVSIVDNDSVIPTGLLINEVYVDPAGTNAPYQFIEIRGTPGTSLDEVYFLAIEGDGPSNPGTLDSIINLSGETIGANGLLVVVAETGGFDASVFSAGTNVARRAFFNSSGPGAGEFETGSNSYVLIYRNPTGPALPTAATDLDTDNIQLQDLSARLGLEGLDASVTVFDAIGATDGGSADIVYGAQLVAPVTSAAIDAIVRFDGNNTVLDPSAFYYGALTGANTPSAPQAFTSVLASRSTNFPEGGAVTPGQANVVGAADTTAPTVVSAVFNPALGQKVVVTFSEDVRNVANGLTASDFSLTSGATTVALSVSSVSADGKTVTLVFGSTGGLAGGTVLLDGTYAFTVRGGQVADLAGNALAADAASTFKFRNADFNNDDVVGFDDLLALAQSYDPLVSGRTYAQGDANYDGKVDFDDLLALAQRYGNGAPLATLAAQLAPAPAPAKAKAPAAKRAVLGTDKAIV